jgi:hypothetical protein
MFIVTYSYKRTIEHRQSVSGTGETEKVGESIDRHLARYVIASDGIHERNLALTLLKEDHRHDSAFEFLDEVSCLRIDGILSVKRRLL